MATLGDTLLIHLGIDVEGLKSGLKDAVSSSQKAAQDIGSGQEKQIQKSRTNITELSKTANGALNNVLGIAKRLAGPVTAALSFGAMLKSYWGGMGQVAQMTGAYYKQLDEWREKMAALRRYTKEDLELYRRTNRAMTDFRIAMADLSAEIMRSFSPLFKVALDALEAFTKFISDHKEDVTRFLQIIGTIITTALIPAFVKLTAAMLTCPLTWIITLIGLLALAIDDLVVYLRGGDSTFAAFWGPCVEFAKEAWEWIQTVYDAITHTEAFEHLKSAVQDTFGLAKDMVGAVVDVVKILWNGFMQLIDCIDIDGTSVFTTLGEIAVAAINVIVNAFNMLMAAFNMIMGAIIGIATGDFTVLQQGWEKLCDGWKKLWTGVVDLLKSGVKAIVGLVTGLGNTIMNLGRAIANALDISGIVTKVKAKIGDLIGMLPSWMQTDGMKEFAANAKADEERRQNGGVDAVQPTANDEIFDAELPPTGEESASPHFSLSDVEASLHTAAPTPAELVQAQNNNTVNNTTNNRNSTQTINNVTFNNASPETSQRVIETLNDLETNSSSVANSTMATS